MDPKLEPLWQKIVDKLGSLSGLVVLVADEVKIKLAADDQAGADARLAEAEEAVDQLKVVIAGIRRDISDGYLTATEIAAEALQIEKLIDELEDIKTGVDEDDV